MHSELLAMTDRLVCAECRRQSIKASGESLSCASCGVVYPVRDSVPSCADRETLQSAFETGLDAVDPDSHTADEIAKANAVYHNVAAESYDDDNRAVRAISQTGDIRIRELIDWTKTRGADGPLVDFGSGTGHMLEVAGDTMRPRLGLDVSGGMLRVAARKNLPVLLADCRNPPLADGSAGLVVAHSFLHHFKEPRQILAQMVRVLRPGGWLIVDWEPNSGARPRAVARLVARLIHPSMWFRSMPHLQSDAVRRVNELAEYHEVMNPGLDAESLAQHLRSLGCDEVSVIYHSNCASALKPTVSWRARSRALLDGRWPSARNSAVHFLLMARVRAAR